MTIRTPATGGRAPRIPQIFRQAARRPRARCGVHPGAGRTGFTLVEMLVAVGLIIFALTLFAVIFQTATSAMTIAKGIADNDGRVRFFTSQLRDDLKNRTMRLVMPFDVTETIDPATICHRRGYFEISENDPDDDTDDILQFTVQVENTDDAYAGAARALLCQQTTGKCGQTTTIVSVEDLVTLNTLLPSGDYWLNQPEFDDGIVGVQNGTGSSPAAEVSYFLRNGTLYRRVLLIRKPPASAPSGDPNPYDSLGNSLSLSAFEDQSSVTQRNFWTFFDYSAYYDPLALGPKFHGVCSLNNDPSTAKTQFVLGKPNFRLGHDRESGLTREFVDHYVDRPGDPLPGKPGIRYIGRFTHWETSFENPTGAKQYPGNVIQAFGYPGRFGIVGSTFPNPFDTTSVPLTLDTREGVVVNYSQWDASENRCVPGPRATEDVLLRNVLRFDIKVWDEAASPGPDGQPGVGFAPGPNGIYEHGGGDDVPVDDDNEATCTPNNNHEFGWPGSDDGAFVDLGHGGARGWYRAGALLNLRPNGTSYYCPTIDPAIPAGRRQFRYDSWHPAIDFQGNGQMLWSGAPDPDDRPPFRPATFGLDNAPGTIGVDDDQNGIVDWDASGNPDPGEMGFGDDKPRPLKAIQIRITIMDPVTGQIRESTTVFSLAP